MSITKRLGEPKVLVAFAALIVMTYIVFTQGQVNWDWIATWVFTMFLVAPLFLLLILLVFKKKGKSLAPSLF